MSLIDEAIKLFEQRNYAEAIFKFDLVEATNPSYDVYYYRGCCLQFIDYHLDAIDDFTRLINLSPGEANLYFMRSTSYSALGDIQEAWRDNITAVQLSKNDSDINKKEDKRAKEMGYSSATLFYERSLNFLKINADMPEDALRKISKPRIRRKRK